MNKENQNEIGFFYGKGAQDECYKYYTNAKFFTCLEVDIGVDIPKGTKTYRGFDNIKHFFKFEQEYKTKYVSENCFYEQLTSELVEVYDIDGHFDLPCFRGKSNQDIIDEFIRARSSFGIWAKNKYNINNYAIGELYIKTTPDPNNKKASLHIIHRNGFKFKDISQAKIFSKIFMTYITENNFSIIFDSSIYSKNRNIRMLGSHKFGQTDRIATRFNQLKAKKQLFCASYLKGGIGFIENKKGGFNMDECALWEQYVTGDFYTLDGVKLVSKHTLMNTIIPTPSGKTTSEVNEQDKRKIPHTDISLLLDLIYTMVESKNHSLCDTEIPNKINYCNWKNLAFCFINSCVDIEYKYWKIIYSLYRHNDETKTRMTYNNMINYKDKYSGLSSNTLHYWAQENPEYINTFPKISRMRLYSHICQKAKDDAPLAYESIQYIFDCNKLTVKTLYLDSVEKILGNIIYKITAGGKYSLITKNRKYDSVVKKYRNYYENTKFKKIACVAGLKLATQVINEQYEIELDQWFIDIIKKPDIQPPKMTKIRLLAGGTNDTGIFDQMLIFSRNVKTYDRIVFKPFLHPEEIQDHYSDDFNLFNKFPFYDEFSAGLTSPDKYINSLLRKHIKETLCNNDLLCFEYFENYIADMIQNPSQKPDVCIIFSGVQGTGKDMTINAIERMMGRDLVLIVGDMNNFLKNFNKEQEGKILTYLNELSDKGAHFDKHDKLKHQITQNTIRIEPKGVDPYEVDHCSRYIGGTNKENVLHVEASERRYLMIKTNNEFANNEVYFKPIWVEIDSIDLTSSMFHYFAAKDISQFIVRKLPDTEYKKEQKLQCLSNPIQFLLEFVRDDERNPNNDINIHTQDFYCEFLSFCTQSGISQHNTRKTFLSCLSEFGIKEWSSKFSIEIRDKTYFRNGFKLQKSALTLSFKSFLKDDSFNLFPS
jgi:hypothetical protein